MQNKKKSGKSKAKSISSKKLEKRWGAKVKRAVQNLLKAIFFLGITVILGIGAINSYMILKTKEYILSVDKLKSKAEKGGFDYILVLGAGVRPNGEPSAMLKERINQGVEAYRVLAQTPILMSGDSVVDRYYKETKVMVEKAIEQNVPTQAIVEDKYGISTYDSIWRLKHIFKAKKVLIITQKYHLIRSIYLARCFNITAYGLDAQKVRYGGQLYRDIREVLARVKDFGLGLLQPQPKQLK